MFGLGYRRRSVLSIGAYGELKYGFRHTRDDGQHDGFDAARVVLLPTFQITRNIIFNAEIEFEHGGIARDADDKLTGAVEVEQAYLDFKFNDHFNWRAPGVDVVPFGFINLFHEPTQFYSVDRPELAQGLIPTTWYEGSTSVCGKIVVTPEQLAAIEAASGQKPLARAQQVWRATKGGQLQGWFIVDYVIGKYLAIDYAVALTTGGAVKQVEILEYRASYGGEVRNAGWRKQFEGETARSPLALNQDIANFSGATLSSRHVTEGVKRVLATHETCLKGA